MFSARCMVIMSTNELSESDSMDNRFHHVLNCMVAGIASRYNAKIKSSGTRIRLEDRV
jgi:hypothetical protein